jgi:hypothetical protein
VGGRFSKMMQSQGPEKLSKPIETSARIHAFSQLSLICLKSYQALHFAHGNFAGFVKGRLYPN